jgi:chondroitin 4-sulfotransferase 11
MLYSSKRKFIFIHIQKTAGTSIEVALAGITPDAIRKFEDLPQSNDPLKNRHLFASDLKSYFDPVTWESCFKFAFVRNPWSRLVSWYNMCIERPSTPFMRIVKRETSTFEEFLNLTHLRADRTRSNQADYVTDASGHLIVDFIGRFEQITKDFEIVCKHLQVELKLPHKNQGTSVDYRTYYTDKTRKLVSDRFAVDIELFGYQFEDGDGEMSSEPGPIEEKPTVTSPSAQI